VQGHEELSEGCCQSARPVPTVFRVIHLVRKVYVGSPPGRTHPLADFFRRRRGESRIRKPDGSQEGGTDVARRAGVSGALGILRAERRRDWK
jgi:hypothetical protein